jgi:hypothetical protein
VERNRRRKIGAALLVSLIAHLAFILQGDSGGERRERTFLFATLLTPAPYASEQSTNSRSLLSSQGSGVPNCPIQPRVIQSASGTGETRNITSTPISSAKEVLADRQHLRAYTEDEWVQYRLNLARALRSDSSPNRMVWSGRVEVRVLAGSPSSPEGLALRRSGVDGGVDESVVQRIKIANNSISRSLQWDAPLILAIEFVEDEFAERADTN